MIVGIYLTGFVLALGAIFFLNREDDLRLQPGDVLVLGLICALWPLWFVVTVVALGLLAISELLPHSQRC